MSDKKELTINIDTSDSDLKYHIVGNSVPLVDWSKSTDKDNVYLRWNCDGIYHWNNYILHGNKGSLVWLKNNGYIYSLQQLFYFFGYDKEEMINKSILDELGNDPVSNYPRTFVGWDIGEKLQIREGLLKTIEGNSTASDSKYYTITKDFMYYFAYTPGEDIPEDDYRRQFTVAERRKVIAYMIDAIQPLYEKYNGNDGYGVDDKYFIGVEDAIWNILFDDHELLRQIEANDCYGLPNLAALLQKMREDDRFVNPQTGVLEPWKWSPGNVN